MQKLLDEYRRSLKMPEAEELLDLVFYRPIAFLFVKIIYRLPITPNQVTILSMIAGIIAGRYFAIGTSAALILAAFWYAFANILDCSDGQLARLQNSGTALGRIVDGVADYISSVAIFLGIGFGLSGGSQWLLVIAAGISSAPQAVVFDHYQNEFISSVRREENFLEKEQERFAETIRRSKEEKANVWKRFFIRMYLAYLGLQTKFGSKKAGAGYSPEAYRRSHHVMIRFWSFLGPTTNRSLLIVCALLNRVDVFLWAVVLPANMWLMCCIILQRRIDKRLRYAQE